jgi:tetratricopeptide (TPR) repeat protein
LLKVAPDNAGARNNLAWHLVTIADPAVRNPKEALVHARRAVKLDPEPWAYWNTLSISAYRADELKEALHAREEVIRRKDDGSAMCWNGLGLAMIRWRLGQKEEARKAYDRVAEQAKKYSFLKSFRQEAAQLLRTEPTVAARPHRKPLVAPKPKND